MGREIYLHCCFLLACAGIIVGLPVEVSKNMLEKISVCPIVSFVKKSAYFSDCLAEYYPTSYVEDGNVPKCMLLYDITDRICTYESLVKIGNSSDKLNLPQTAEEFDATLKKLEPPSDGATKVETIFCENIKTLFEKLNTINIQPVKDVIPYEKKYAAESLLNQECQYSCHSKNGKIDKFCMVLLWANDLFKTVKPVVTQTNSKAKSPVVQNLTTTNVAQTAQEVSVKVDKTKVVDNNADSVKQIIEQKKSQPSNSAANPSAPKLSGIEETAGKSPVKDESGKIEQINNQQPKISAADNENVDIESKPQSSSKKPKTTQIDDSQNQSKILPPDPKLEPKTPDMIDNPVQSALQPEDQNPDTFVSEEEQNIKNNEDAIKNYDPAILDMGEKFNEPEKVMKEKPIPKSKDDSDFLPYEGQKYLKPTIRNEESESHFFAYFSLISMCCVLMYIGYHNKQKILAMLLEGRRGRRARGSRRRPSTASYRKLDSNLEEAVTSQCSSNVTHVIY